MMLVTISGCPAAEIMTLGFPESDHLD